MEGGREQSVWFRFQQVMSCEGENMAPPCKLHGKPQHYDTYWYSFSPITDRWIRPELMANASGFYGNMLKVKRYWDAELAAEGMMEVQLPATPTTNGTWLAHQSVFSFVRSMISRDNTWHPRYGVIPGYGITLQDGFQDTFTSTATAALEWGSLPYIFRSSSEPPPPLPPSPSPSPSFLSLFFSLSPNLLLCPSRLARHCAVRRIFVF